MSLSAGSNLILKQIKVYLTDVWNDLCHRWGLAPIPPIAGLTLWIGWTSLTWLAFLFSLAVVEVGERGDISFLDGLLGGGLVGLVQWFILRLFVHKAYRWIIVNAMIWGTLALLHIGALGWIAPAAPSLTMRLLAGLFYGAYVGLALGVGQWWVMRNALMNAWRWVPLSAGIWSVSMAFGWFIGGELRLVSHLFVAEVFGLVSAWGMIAILSGVALVGMVYQQDKSVELQSNRSQ